MWRVLWQARRRLDRAAGGPLNGRGWVQIPAVGGFFIAIAMAADVWHHIAASMGALQQYCLCACLETAESPCKQPPQVVHESDDHERLRCR